MKTQRRSAAAAVLLVALVASMSRGQPVPRLTPAEARKGIAEANREWGKARVAFDRPTFEKMLAPDFYVALEGKKVPRQEFLEMISTPSPGSRLTRFDVRVLTLQPWEDGWAAVIEEKLEFERADGKGKSYNLWITRDGWKKVGDRWVAYFSEAVGNEAWRQGATPPFQDW
jgi:Domain of unknown function (DUF4440)